MSGVHCDQCRIRLLYGGSSGKMQTEKVIAYMIIAGLIGFLIDTIMVLAEKVLLRWRAQ